MAQPPFLFDNLLIFSALVATLLLGLGELGYRIGLHLFTVHDKARRSQIGGVQGAALALLGLLLGFTFSMGVDRFEIRRDLVLKEANAVGTTWLRAGLLPEAHRTPVKDLLRHYVDVRLKFERLASDPALLAEGLGLSGKIENELWQHAETAAREAATPITATFIVALNEMIDTDAERISAGRNRIPVLVVVLVILVAGFGCFTTSYGAGAVGARSAFANIALPLLITAVIALIFDITHPRQGFIGISQQPLLDLQQTMRMPLAK